MSEANRKKFIAPSDYGRSITKSYKKKKADGSSSSSGVAQLGTQKKQSIEPLVVLPPEQQGQISFLKSLGLLSVETHRRVATSNTKSREVAGALAGTAPSSTARNSVTRPEVLWKTGRAT